jgi:hypothetical protein
MELPGLLIGVIGLVPVAYFAYTRLIQKSHKIDINVGNVSLARVISPNPSHNEKLALVIYGLTLVNSGPDPVTPKDIFLRYRFRKKLEASMDSIPTGAIQGKESVVMTNASDRIIVAWNNLRDALLERRVLQKGETISGSAVFFLDAPVDQYLKVTDCMLHIRDYSGRHSKHKLPIGPGWHSGIEKGIVLVDAPACYIGGIISWEGIAIGKQKA